MAATSVSLWQSANGTHALSYDDVARKVWVPIDPKGGMQELLRAATLGANSHNTQPWRFAVSDRHILIQPDYSRRCRAVDPDDHHLFASLGCATENLVHVAASMDFRATAEFDTANSGSISVALETAPVGSSRLVSSPRSASGNAREQNMTESRFR